MTAYRNEKAKMWAWKRSFEVMGFHVTLFSQPFKAAQTAGIPDMYIRHDRWRIRLWIEVKHGRNKPTPAQAEWIEGENASGGNAMVAWEMDEVLDRLRQMGAPIEVWK